MILSHQLVPLGSASLELHGTDAIVLNVYLFEYSQQK